LICILIWGGYLVCQNTLIWFLSLHFIVPLVLLVLVVLHIATLHIIGSTNLHRNTYYISFIPNFLVKDLFSLILFLFCYTLLFNLVPNFLRDCENYIHANPLVTPIHIKPEWYFLFAYCILWAVPNKTLGVLGLAASIVIIFVNVKIYSLLNLKKFGIGSVLILYSYCFLMLTYLGGILVESPYVIISQFYSSIYFCIFL